jgi:RHS repeat-associated protein
MHRKGEEGRRLMKTAKMMVLATAFLMGSMHLSAQSVPVCDSGGVCGTNPDRNINPSYGGLVAARPMVQNARGTRSPQASFSGGPGTVPIINGSQSYNKAFPIVSLPGRGLDLNLVLYYNSRIWDIDTVNSTISFNADRDYPTYGFRLDFGFMEYDANTSQFILTENDGSKHSMPITSNTANGSIFDSNDGTNIEFNNKSLILIYGNGTTMYYQPFPSQATLFRPIKIRDRNGNFITITYIAGSGNDQHIDAVVDTLGRVIKFNYDTANHLSQITQAVSTSTDLSGTHIWATFSWAQVLLNYSFSSDLSVQSSPPTGSSIWVLKGCSFANLTGYGFSYSTWGMINHIDQLSSTGLVRSYETYNYPDTSQPLSDAPRYGSMVISPDGMATSQWNYAETQSAVGQVTSQTVTDPFSTSSITTLNANGTLKSSQIQDNTGKVFRKADYVWTTTAPPRIASVSTTDDAGNQSSVSYVYDAYGNVTDLSENDFGGNNIRHTITTYKQAPYTTNHIFSLQQSLQVKDSGGTLRQKTDFDYDQTPPTVLGAVTHNETAISTPRGNLTSVTRYPDVTTPANAITRNFTYDTTGNQTVAEADCCGKERFNFDPGSQYAYATSVVRGPDNGQQFTSSFAFNFDNGLKLSGTDENNQQTSYVYDIMGRVKTLNSPPSNGTPVSQTIIYGDDILAPTVTSSTTANNAKIVQTLDGLEHLVREDTIDSSTGITVSTTQFQYDPIWRRKATSNPYAAGGTLLWNNTSYDVLNRATSITPPSGGSTQINFVGPAVTITDPAGKQRKNYVDGLGRLVRVDEPGWGDALDALDSISIAGAERTKLISTRYCAAFDLHGRCVDWEFDTSTDYDTGTVTTIINGVSYKYAYGQTDTSSTIASSLASKINADPGRVVSASLSGGTINLYAVNLGVGGNSISVSTSSLTSNPAEFGSSTTSFPSSTFTPTLTGGENALSQANAVLTGTRHLTTTYTYDVLGHLRGVSQGAMGPVNGQQLAGQSRSYVYDDLGRLTSTSTPESGAVSTFYSSSQGAACSGDPTAVCRKVDARGIVTSFAYSDPLNRLTSVSYSDTTPSVIFSYDGGGQAAFALGRLTSVTEGTNSQTLIYDNLGRTTSVTQLIDQVPYLTQYAYNPLGQAIAMTYPSGRVVTQGYDSIGRVSSISSGGTTYLSGVSYNAGGETLGVSMGNGVQGSFTYNDHMQLQSLRYFMTGVAQDILNLGYDYTSAAQLNDNGKIQGVHYFSQPGVEDTTKSESFTYDPWSRLSTAQTSRVDSTAGTWSLQWTYDRLGNRLSQKLIGGNISVGQPNFVVNAASNQIIGYCYDAAGNLTDQSMCPSGIHQYSYDGASRLVSINPTAASYTYFGSRRIRKVVGSTTTRYIYSGLKPIAEYVNSSTTPTTEYVYSGAQLLVTIAGSNLTYHHPDHLSNRAETGASGIAVRTYGYLPYGESWYETGTADKWKFAGYERDLFTGETGLDYAFARFSSSSSGQFISPDPLAGSILSPESMNRYAYVTNDPVNLTDPLGLAGGNWRCLLLNTGDCVGGDYAGAGLNATAGMGIWGDPLGNGLPGQGNTGCAIDGQAVDCALARVAEGMGGIPTLCEAIMGCGVTYVNFNGAPSGPDWVQPGRGDPDLSNAGCLVNVGSSGWGDMVWCPGWGGMSFDWGGNTEFQISNMGKDSVVFKHKASRHITPTMSAKPPLTLQDARALCTIAATNASNGTGGSVGNPGVSVSTGYGIYTSASGTPKLGDQSVVGNGIAAGGGFLSMITTYGSTYAGCISALGF